MAKFSRTWWGERFIGTLEQFTDSARLGRGRSYARGGKVLEFKLSKGKITARVKGSINPYFGVYKTPYYKVTVEIPLIPSAKWSKVIEYISSKAGFISRLMMNEMPDHIETAFSHLGLHLLPHSSKDLITDCSCPDWANPCKHIAGVYYLVASELDHNPFLMFELRGFTKKELQKELAKSSLGKALSEELKAKKVAYKSSDSLFTRPYKEKAKAAISLKEFWSGKKRLSNEIKNIQQTTIPAVLIKKQGDYPVFWQKDVSFVEVMEQLYQRVKTKNKDAL